MAPRTERAALIVAHGRPSAPEGPERVLAALAAEVAAALGAGWHVGAATLASPGALGRAAAAARAAAPSHVPLLVRPHFMTEGWFTAEELPRRLAAAAAGEVRMLPPFGADPALPAFALSRVRAALAERGWRAAETGLLVAAHGHPSDPRAGRAARAFADALAAAGGFRALACGFIDEAPGVAEAARALAPPAVCLPFFAMRARHVDEDLPAALAEGGFAGPLLGPLGEGEGVASLIAAALARHAAPGAA